MSESGPLTERELEILRQVATGASNRLIARRLDISANTVKVHLHNIYNKLHVASRTEATMVGLQAGLISDTDLPEPSTIRQNWERPKWLVPLLLAGLLLAAVVLADIVFRVSNRAPGTTVDLQRLETSRWEELMPMPTPRHGMATIAHQSMVYAIAGETSDGVTGIVERFEPSTDTWESLVTKPTPVTDVGAAVIGGKIYVPGGQLRDGSPTDILEVFDPLSGSWETGPSMPGGLYGYAITAYEGRLYLFGGTDGEGPLSEVWIYDPEAGGWRSGASLSQPRMGAAAVPLSSGILLAGGRDATELVSTVAVYRPDLEDAGRMPWTVSSDLPQPGRTLDGESFGGIAYFVGATDKSGAAVIQEYVGQSETWQTLAVPYAGPWSDQSTSRLGDYLYVMGGLAGESPTQRTVRYKAIFTVLFPNVQ